MTFEHFVSSFLQNVIKYHGEAFRTYNIALQQQIYHIKFIATLVCKTENFQMVLSSLEVVQNDIDSGKVSWQDENYFRCWQSDVLDNLNLGKSDKYNVKEESKENDTIAIDFTENLFDDLVCIKFKVKENCSEKENRMKKLGGKRKEKVTLKTFRNRERKEKKTLTCDSCENFSTKIVKKMERHLFEVHENTMCHVCGLNFTSFEKLHSHSLSHNESIICNKCGAEFKEQRSYLSHMSRKHPSENSKFACQHCGKTYSNSSSLNVHIKYVHEKNFVPLLCPYEDCNTTFTHNCDLRRHISLVHEQSMEKCQWCGKIVKHIQKHLKINQCNIPEEERVKIRRRPLEKKECDICQKLVSKGNLGKHMQTMHGHGNPAEFYCDQCSYKTNIKYNLKLHVIRVHEGRYHKKKCPHCLKDFIDLEYHIKTFHYDTIFEK